MKKIHKKIASVFLELGILDSCYYFCDKILNAASVGRIRIIRYHIVVQPVSDKPFCSPTRGRNVVVREVFPGDKLEAYFPVGKEVLAERYAQGGRCLVAEKEGHFVGYLWFIKDQYIEDEVRVIFQLPNEKSIWDFDIYVEPKCRIGFVFLRLWDELYSTLYKERVEHSYSRISAFNSASRNSHKRLGAKTLHHATFLKIGAVQFMFSGSSPYVYISFSGSSIPILQLQQL